jgi:hypothetical protein
MDEVILDYAAKFVDIFGQVSEAFLIFARIGHHTRCGVVVQQIVMWTQVHITPLIHLGLI